MFIQQLLVLKAHAAAFVRTELRRRLLVPLEMGAQVVDGGEPLATFANVALRTSTANIHNILTSD